ncbi:hypothetical protein HNR59_001840 [Aquamicrobium lusatiense]|uniref:Uncharacterized protein n=1 Tax=Aquamicrobium lusatiense TaxID=89772 RepID=A0A7W9VVR2_9HYPH|nr:hypothetical protein [Aquamicrobium lusatiense]
MNQIKASLQPFLFGGVHPGQGSRKVRFILCPHVLCLEQQHDCRLQVRQAVRGDCESFAAWAADADIAPADPHVSVTRFQHHVGAPAVFCCVQTPYLEHVRPWLAMRRQKLYGSAERGAELQRQQRPAKKRQVAADDCELYIFMVPGLAAMPQIQRPSPGYAPRGFHIAEFFRKFMRLPRLPCVVGRQIRGGHPVRILNSSRPIDSTI